MATTAHTPTSYFIRVPGRPGTFLPTEHVGGAWTVDEQHISPMNGLVVHEVERFVEQATPGGDGLQIGRLSSDILGVLTLEPFTIGIEVLRPGRTIQLLEVTVSQGGRAAERTRIWRMVAGDTSEVHGGAPEPLPDPASVPAADLTDVWPGGYIASLEFRPVHGPAPGRTTAWIVTDVTLLPDEPVSDLARFAGLIDTANGIAVRRRPEEWLFPNIELTVHLNSQPRGRWIGFDTAVTFGPNGLGTTSSVLYDQHGAVGQAAQSLTLRPRS